MSLRIIWQHVFKWKTYRKIIENDRSECAFDSKSKVLHIIRCHGWTICYVITRLTSIETLLEFSGIFTQQIPFWSILYNFKTCISSYFMKLSIVFPTSQPTSTRREGTITNKNRIYRWIRCTANLRCQRQNRHERETWLQRKSTLCFSLFVYMQNWFTWWSEVVVIVSILFVFNIKATWDSVNTEILQEVQSVLVPYFSFWIYSRGKTIRRSKVIKNIGFTIKY